MGILIERIRPLFSSFLRPLARICSRLGVHPNVLTVAGVAVFVPVAWLLAIGRWKSAVAVGAAGAVMDGLDGLVAREFGKQSVFGAVLDSTCDRLTEILVLGGLLVYYLIQPQRNILGPVLCLCALSGSLMVSYVKARAEGAGLVCTTGILQRADRLVVLGAFLLAGRSAALWGLGTVAVLSFFTVLQRLASSFVAARASDVGDSSR